MKHRLRDFFRPLIPVKPREKSEKSRHVRSKRTHPEAVQHLDVYNGNMDELTQGFDLTNNCGWCGKSLEHVKVIYECTYDGFSHCSSKCQSKMDDWIMDNLIEPEGEIHDLTGLTENEVETEDDDDDYEEIMERQDASEKRLKEKCADLGIHDLDKWKSPPDDLGSPITDDDE